MTTTGVISNNSTFEVGTATIVADVSFNLTDSAVKVGDLKHFAPNTPGLSEILKALPSQPPEELVREAIAQLKAGGNVESLENSKLEKWFKDQGINAAFWAQFAVGLASIG